MQSDAGGRPGEADARGGMATGQSQSRLQRLGDRAPGGCPRPALVCPAYFHPPPDRAALSHRLEMRDPGPGPRCGAAFLDCALNCALEHGLRCVRRVFGKGRLGGRRVWSLYRNPPQPRILTAGGPAPRRDWKLVHLTFEESEGEETLLHSQ